MHRLLAFSLCAAAATLTSLGQDAAVAAPAAAQPAPVPAVVAPAAPAVSTPEAAAGAGSAAHASKARVTINRCNVEGPYIAITFDDGPHGVQTPRLLKMLRDRGIRATFFVVGQCVAANPEIAKQIVKEGHEIANHSWNHPSLSKMSMEAVRDQLDRTHNVTRQEAEVAPTLMRPPFGNFTTQQRAWAYATWGYTVVLWDVDSLDWKHRSPAKTEAIILADTKPGSIILCHDIHKTTVDAMPDTLDKLLAKGFKFVTVSELMKMHKEPAVPVKTAKATPVKASEAKDAPTTLEDLRKAPARKAVPAKAQ